LLASFGSDNDKTRTAASLPPEPGCRQLDRQPSRQPNPGLPPWRLACIRVVGHDVRLPQAMRCRPWR